MERQTESARRRERKRGETDSEVRIAKWICLKPVPEVCDALEFPDAFWKIIPEL